MKWIVTLVMTMALLTGWWFVSRPDSPLIDYSVREFDVGLLLGLQSFGDFDPDLEFTHDLSVIFYFSSLSCSTCTTRELRNLADWYEKYRDRVDFFLVVQGQDDVYLHNLKRLGDVKYPILLEAEQGDMGFAHTCVMLMSKNEASVLATYYPQVDPKTADDILFLETYLVGQIKGT